MSKRKKVVILSCMIALLAVTAVCNFVLTSSTVNPTESTLVSNANYFSQYRNERLTTRNEEILQLDSIIDSAEANSTAISTLYKLNEISPQSFAVDYDPYQENSSTEGVKNSIGTLAKGEEFEDGEYASMINRLHNEAKTITNEIKQ